MENDLYDIDVNLIFYDSPIAGSFQNNFYRIGAERRYTDLSDNVQYYASVYAGIREAWKPADWWLAHADLPPGAACFAGSILRDIHPRSGCPNRGGRAAAEILILGGARASK